MPSSTATTPQKPSIPSIVLITNPEVYTTLGSTVKTQFILTPTKKEFCEDPLLYVYFFK